MPDRLTPFRDKAIAEGTRAPVRDAQVSLPHHKTDLAARRFDRAFTSVHWNP